MGRWLSFVELPSPDCVVLKIHRLENFSKDSVLNNKHRTPDSVWQSAQLCSVQQGKRLIHASNQIRAQPIYGNEKVCRYGQLLTEILRTGLQDTITNLAVTIFVVWSCSCENPLTFPLYICKFGIRPGIGSPALANFMKYFCVRLCTCNTINPRFEKTVSTMAPILSCNNHSSDELEGGGSAWTCHSQRKTVEWRPWTTMSVLQ